MGPARFHCATLLLFFFKILLPTFPEGNEVPLEPDGLEQLHKRTLDIIKKSFKISK
jgi:hypothetical protein